MKRNKVETSFINGHWWMSWCLRIRLFLDTYLSQQNPFFFAFGYWCLFNNYCLSLYFYDCVGGVAVTDSRWLYTDFVFHWVTRNFTQSLRMPQILFFTIPILLRVVNAAYEYHKYFEIAELMRSLMCGILWMCQNIFHNPGTNFHNRVCITINKFILQIIFQ